MERVTPFIRSGTTRRPCGASCSGHAGGMSHAPTVTMIASKGSGSPGTPYSASAGTTLTRWPYPVSFSSVSARRVTSGSMSTLTTRPSGPTTSASSAALQPPEPISSTLMPGPSRACSIIRAWMKGALTLEMSVPRSSVLTFTATSAA